MEPFSGVYANLDARIRALVGLLNDALGLSGAPHNERVTYGYVGNDRDIVWSVYLPHPGRVGTYADQIGAHATNDIEGATSTLAQLAGALKLAEWAKEGRPFTSADELVGAITLAENTQKRS